MPDQPIDTAKLREAIALLASDAELRQSHYSQASLRAYAMLKAAADELDALRKAAAAVLNDAHLMDTSGVNHDRRRVNIHALIAHLPEEIRP